MNIEDIIKAPILDREPFDWAQNNNKETYHILPVNRHASDSRRTRTVVA